MTTKIKYTFINGDVLEVEAEDSFAAYILMDRLREENSNRKHRRYNFSLDSMRFEDERFATQWGNPEKHLITHEEYEALSKILEELTSTQKTITIRWFRKPVQMESGKPISMMH